MHTTDDRLAVRGLRALIAMALILFATTATAAERLTPTQLQGDLRVLVDTIRHQHPDVAHSVAPADFDAALASLAHDLRKPLTRDEAWERFARINPLLADAHFAVLFDDPAAATKAHLAAGGGLFPFEVHIDDAGDLFVAARLGGAATSLARTRIARIDGVDSRRIVRRLLALVHGETPALRARLLSKRWYFYYWKIYGAPANYDFVLDRRGARGLREPASHTLPQTLAARANFEQTYRFELRPDQAAVLTVDSFYWPDPERWFAFADDAFAQMRKAGTRTLVIDVRNNEGGDDDLWKRGILRHIAGVPYRWASTYRKRIMQADPDKGEAVGDIVDGEVANRVQPEPDDPLHYDGKVIVLIGDATYSSSVLFANVVAHYGFGTLAGARGGVARTRQSGGTRSTTLPNSGLVVGWPRFILDPPGGRDGDAWLRPARIVCDDPFDRSVAVRAALGDASACR